MFIAEGKKNQSTKFDKGVRFMKKRNTESQSIQFVNLLDDKYIQASKWAKSNAEEMEENYHNILLIIGLLSVFLFIFGILNIETFLSIAFFALAIGGYVIFHICEKRTPYILDAAYQKAGSTFGIEDEDLGKSFDFIINRHQQVKRFFEIQESFQIKEIELKLKVTHEFENKGTLKIRVLYIDNNIVKTEIFEFDYLFIEWRADEVIPTLDVRNGKLSVTA